MQSLIQRFKDLKAANTSDALALAALIFMAGEQGFEPWYAGIKIRCLNQLGDSPTQSDVCRLDETSNQFLITI